jgi:hypothetical protein
MPLCEQNNVPWRYCHFSITDKPKVVDGWFLFSSCPPESTAQLDEPSLDIFRGSRSNKGKSQQTDIHFGNLHVTPSNDNIAMLPCQAS